MPEIFKHGVVILFVILAIGSWLGSLTFRGFSIGSAGVLFVALLAGHLGGTVPREVMELGLILFVYAVGLQAGPQFFRMFRRRGLQYMLCGALPVLGGGLVTLLLARLMGIDFQLSSGLYCGALTCTPALAGAMEVANRESAAAATTVSVGYGIAYPFSIFSMVLVVQLLPRLLGRKITDEEERFREEHARESPGLKRKRFRVTNPACFGKTFSELNAKCGADVVISRIRHAKDGHIEAAVPGVILQERDLVLAVGAESELEKLRQELGEETTEFVFNDHEVVYDDIQVTAPELIGKSLRSLQLSEKYGVVLTRIRRQGVEFTPSGRASLEFGDSVRVVGAKELVDEFSDWMDAGHSKTEETTLIPFLLGLCLGVLIGQIAIPLSSTLTLKLGNAGGVFLVSLLIGHFGRIGNYRLFVPAAAKNFSRELGLMIFLAGAGTTAGAHFWEVLTVRGPSLLIAGAVITLTVFALTVLMMHWLYRSNVLASMGALAATMTNPPALSAANSTTSSDLPTLTYASMYPVALIVKILLAQVILLLSGH